MTIHHRQMIPLYLTIYSTNHLKLPNAIYHPYVCIHIYIERYIGRI
jgi:hypothetical protein